MNINTAISGLLCVLIFMSNLAFAQNTSELSAVEVQDKFGPWTKHGKLDRLTARIKSGYLSIYIYKDPAGEWITLSNNIGGLNEFLKQEIDSKEIVDQFMNEQLSQFLLSTMTVDDSFIITKQIITGLGILKIDPREADSTLVPPMPAISQEKASKLNQKLESYVSDDKPTVLGNQWTLDFNVRNRRGGIEHWVVKGKLDPFQIILFTREIKEADGTFPPLILIR